LLRLLKKYCNYFNTQSNLLPWLYYYFALQSTFNTKFIDMKKLQQSIRHATNGILWFVLADRNGKIHLLAMLLVIAVSNWLHISPIEFSILMLCCAKVIGLEMVNHAIEQFCNDYHAGYKTAIKTIKDVSAGAVLWCSILSAVIACIIYYPYLNKFF
jgi:diacylglycerol kinase